MDFLSDIIRACRLGLPHSAHVLRRPPFHRRLPQSEAAGFHVVLRGKCWLEVPGLEPSQLGPGDVVFLPRGSPHALMDRPGAVSINDDIDAPNDGSIEQISSTVVKNASSADVVMLCGAYLIDRSFHHPLLSEMPAMLHFRAETDAQWQLRSTIDLLDAEIDRGQSGADSAVCALLDLMFLYIIRSWLAEECPDRKAAGWSAALKDQRISAALSGIHREPEKPWTVGSLARAAGLSRAAFSRRFSGLIGQSPAAYVTLWRMLVASRLMQDTDQSLAAIASQVGYSSEYGFAHAFKRLHGISPGAHRRRSRKQRASLSAGNFR